MTSPEYFLRYASPIGSLGLYATDDAIVRISYEDGPEVLHEKRSSLLESLVLQLDEYFLGHRQRFDLPLYYEGTDFQKQSWQVLRNIPYGETRSYTEQAVALGSPRACRAVGQANNKNPLSIVVPCHRVVSASGTLTGYAGGVDKKQWLLEHEQHFV